MTILRQLFVVPLAALLWISLAGSCGSPASECGSDADCATGEQCISAGGVLASGGTCVAENLLRDGVGRRDTGDEPADTGPPTHDTRMPDVDPTSDDGTSDAAADGDAEPCQTGETRSCYNGPDGTDDVGACSSGTQTCRPDGTWGDCIGPTLPSSTRCDGTDNDCDGVVDEGCQCNYEGTATGVCSRGSRDESGICSVAPGSYESQEASCDTLDNDCDGVVDEGCSCNFAGSSSGVCTDGVIGSEGKCTSPAGYERDETSCDGSDNDCDGATDEGVEETYYRDRDGDDYGDPEDPKKACNEPSGYVSNQKDCYDENDDAYPGRSAGFEQHRGDGSFDYNCDKTEEKLLVDKYECSGSSASTCLVVTPGWFEDIPSCGKSGDWVMNCQWNDDAESCIPTNATSRPQKCR